MKKNILVFLFSFSILALNAQNITLDPPQIDIQEELNAANDNEGHSTVTNPSSTAKRFKWERNVLNITTGWESAVCDKIRCYFPHVNTAEFDLDPMEGGDMIVHVYPNQIVGSASIEVKITDTSDVNNTITGLFNFEIGTTGLTELNRQLLKVYPNPTVGDINLQFLLDRPTAMKVEVQNMIGQRMSMTDYGKLSGNQTLTLNQGDLNNGIYFVVIHMDEYVVTRKVRVSK